ncbi:TPA: hypothetical protein ACH3X1_013820 [Trebouxia sp. C0004]
MNCATLIGVSVSLNHLLPQCHLLPVLCIFNSVSGLQHHLLHLPAPDCRLRHCTIKPTSVPLRHPNAASCATSVHCSAHTDWHCCICRARQTRQSRLGLQVTPSDHLLLAKTEVTQLQPVSKTAHMCQEADLDQTSDGGCTDCLTLNLASIPEGAQLVAMRRVSSYCFSLRCDSFRSQLALKFA